MLETVRKHNKILMIVLFMLIIPSFVLVGIDGYNRFLEQDRTVARVGNSKITQGEWDAIHRQEVDRLRQMMPGVDARVFDSPQARYATLEQLVRDRVLQVAAERGRLGVTEQKLAQIYRNDPAMAQFRRPDGSFDRDAFIRAAGMTPERYEADLRVRLAARQVEGGVGQSGFLTPQAADLALNAWFDRREVQMVRFPAQEYAARVTPTAAEQEAFYQANQALFQSPEQASIEYVVLDIDAVRKTIRLNEQDVRTYYEQNVARLSGPEERRASHILIAAPKDAADERAKARARAAELLGQVRKAPDSFAALAGKHSQDPGSATKGGDLDFFGRGAMVKPFEEAAFALKKGEISDLVESDFGFHIIKLTDIKAPKQKSFAEIRASLEEELRTQQARARFAEAAEAFSNDVYEQSDSLKPAADKLKLEIRSASGVGRQPRPGVQGALASGKLLEALFSSDSLSSKRNTQAVEIGPSQLAAARITQYSPARTLPLSEVQQAVRERVIQSRAADLAREDGQKKLEAWKAAPDTASLGKAVVVSREQAQDLPPAVLDAALRADAGQLPQMVGVDLGRQGYAVVRVLRRVERAASTPEAQHQARAQYVQWWQQAEGQAYYRWLQGNLQVEIKAPRPAMAARNAS